MNALRGRKPTRDGDSGQFTIVFLGMTPVIVATLVVLWQLVLVGYTYTLAGNAADEAVRPSAGHGAARAGRRAWTSCRAPGREAPR